MTDHRDTDLDDPEDAYDVSDPTKERLLNFARRLNYLIDRTTGDITARLERLRDDIDKLRSQLAD